MPLSLSSTAAGCLRALAALHPPLQKPTERVGHDAPSHAHADRTTTDEDSSCAESPCQRDQAVHLPSVPHSSIADFRGMVFKEKVQPAAHRSFVRQLREGRATITMMPHGHTGYDVMRVRMDGDAATLTWSISTGDAANEGGAVALESVVSIVPWTHKQPSTHPTRAELLMGHDGVFYGFSVAYFNSKNNTPHHIMVLCRDETEQGQLVSSFRSLVHAARLRGGHAEPEMMSAAAPQKAIRPTSPGPKKPARTIRASSSQGRSPRGIRQRLSTIADSFFRGSTVRRANTSSIKSSVHR